ncbi:MAG: 5-formyltetrahydrofolate cyclo-ligase [Clostridia bacterium]
MNSELNKIEQRRAIKIALRAMSKEERERASERASLNVLASPEFQSAKTVLIYKAMKSECNPELIEQEAIKLGKTLVYPKCVEDFSLKLLSPKERDAFIDGAYGIKEPDRYRSIEIATDDIDFLLVPGLAFDKFHNRLGRGAGYYDRLLNKARSFTCGFCFSCQIIEQVSCEAHDIPLSAVISDTFRL